MKAKELREKNTEELKRLLQEERIKLNQLRFDVSAHQAKDYKELQRRRKIIARILTILKEEKHKQ